MAMLVGAALDNLDQPSSASYDRLEHLRAEVVGTLWTGATCHRRSVYEALESRLEAPWYHLRVGPSQRLSPRAWIDDARRALDEVPPAAHSRTRLRMLNEVNLPEEGGWPAAEYAAWMVEAAALFDAEGGYPKLSAPLSLGRPDWPDYWATMLATWGDLTGQAIPVDGVAINAYAHLVSAAEPIRSAAAAAGRAVHMTEMNTLEHAPGPARAAWIVDQLAWLEAAGYASCELFVVGGRSYGAWDERYILTEEECDAIGRRSAR